MKNNKDSSQKGGSALNNGKSAHGIKQFECSVDLLSPPHLLGNMYNRIMSKTLLLISIHTGPSRG